MKDITVSISKALLVIDEQYKAKLPELPADSIEHLKYRKIREALVAIENAVDPFGDFGDDYAFCYTKKHGSEGLAKMSSQEFNSLLFRASSEIVSAVRDVLTASLADSDY